VVIALALLLMPGPIASALSADAPRRTVGAGPSDERKVVPRRAPRPISRREIFQVIQNDLAHRGIAERNELQPGDLNIQSSVPALQDDPGLQVERISFDPLRRETVFELWASREPQYLPFDVTTRRSLQIAGITPDMTGKPGEFDGGENPGTGKGALWRFRKAPALAEPGRPATLVMLGQNVRITTTVVPLQPGVKGQCIFVRDPVTARVMKAEVVDEGLLQASF
jgi:hypothetical protein